VSTLLFGLLGVLASTNPPAAASNLVEQTTGIRVRAAQPAEDPRGVELKKLEADDDAALEEIDQWIVENRKFKEEGAGVPDAELNARIHKRLDAVRQAYERFIEKHPEYADARLAYASFLGDIGEEEASVIHLEKARDIDPLNPAVWNNLANYHGHRGSVTNAFAYYEKAIELNSTEPIYYHNFGTTVFLFRKDAREFYNIDEQQVFDKAMSLYSNSMRLDPTNFLMAADIAQSYYIILPLRTNDALQAWTNALKIASDEVEKEGVHVHLARVKMKAGMLSEARQHLEGVRHERHQATKERLLRNLKERSEGASASREPEADQNLPAPSKKPSG